MKYKKHIFICTNIRPSDSGKMSCGNKGVNLRKKFIEVLNRPEYGKLKIRVNKSGCLDECESGPTIAIYPQGFWYYGVALEDVDEIIEESVVRNNYINRLSARKL